MSKLEEVTKELSELRLQANSLDKKIQKTYKRWEKLTKEENKENFKNIDWLIKNPDTPGHFEAMRSFMKEIFGGEYNGVHSSGFTHDGNYKNQEQNFELSLNTYGENKKESYRANVDLFLKDIFPKLQFRQEIDNKKYKPLQYLSETFGLTYLLYCSEEDTWHKGRLRYGRWTVTQKFKNFDEAFETAFYESNSKEDW